MKSSLAAILGPNRIPCGRIFEPGSKKAAKVPSRARLANRATTTAVAHPAASQPTSNLSVEI
jgi:hypothetical protein